MKLIFYGYYYWSLLAFVDSALIIIIQWPLLSHLLLLLGKWC